MKTRHYYKSEIEKPEMAKQMIKGNCPISIICSESNIHKDKIREMAIEIGYKFPDGSNMNKRASAIVDI